MWDRYDYIPEALQHVLYIYASSESTSLLHDYLPRFQLGNYIPKIRPLLNVLHEDSVTVYTAHSNYVNIPSLHQILSHTHSLRGTSLCGAGGQKRTDIVTKSEV